MKLIGLLSLLFFICTLPVIGQTGGKKVDALGLQGALYEFSEESKELPVVGATVKLLSPKDSAVIVVTQSDKEGVFSFSSIKQDDYLLSVTFLGYTPVFKTVSRELFEDKETRLGKIQMKLSPLMLSEVIVTGHIPDIVVKEDTVEYNASAYKTGQYAVVEDLLKRLPGVEVDANGNIKVGGKDVKKILVDGKEFFGKDTKMATKNVQADIVEKVQVIDKKTDEAVKTGVDDGEKETIINLAIKPGKNQGWIGNANVGAGALIDNPANEPARYTGNVMLSRFNEGDLFSFVFNTNNINQWGFSDGNTGNPGGSMESMGGRGRPAGRGGITNSNTVGMSMYKSNNEKLRISGDISYGYSDVLAKSKRFRQNILIDSVSYSESRSENRAYSNRVSFYSNVDYRPDTLNSFTFNSNISYNNSNSSNSSYQSMLAGDADSTRVNQSEASSTDESAGWDISIGAIYSRRFVQKQGRMFSLSGGIDLDRNKGNGTNTSLSEFFLQPGKNQFLNQEMENRMSGNGFNFRVTFVEPVWKNKNSIQFSYGINNNRTNNIRETFDYDSITDNYSVLNPDYSKSLDNMYINQRVGISFNSRDEKFMYNIGFNVIPSYTKSTSYVKNGSYEGNDSILNRIDGRSVVNYSPQARFSYRFHNKSNLYLNYTGNTMQPSVTQLDPTVNNTNPLYISSGNPDLLPSFSNMLMLGYNNFNNEKQQVLNANANFSFVQNEIIYFTDYEESTGIQYSRPINENGSWNTGFNMMFGQPLDKKKRLRFSNNAFFSYNNRIGYMMTGKKSERNVSGTMGIGENISLSFNKDWFYCQLMGNINYSNTTNSLDDQKGRESTNFGLGYYTNLTLPKDWTFFSDISYTGNRGLSAGYNADQVLWNLEISKKFLKKKQAAIRFRWNDILQENMNIYRNVTANYIEDSEFNTLSSYFLVSFIYNFNQMGGRE